MNCPKCGAEIPQEWASCTVCGTDLRVSSPGMPVVPISESLGSPQQSVVIYNTPQQKVASGEPKNRLIFVLLALFLGCLGIHNFYAGHAGRGAAQLLITLFLGWLIVPWVGVIIWVVIEAILIDTDSTGTQMI